MPAVPITTLQRCSRFKNLFDQLELTANEQRIATEVLVNIALRAGVECLAAEVRANKAFLQDTNEITFSDKDRLFKPQETPLLGGLHKLNPY